jgi:hypothetical protein
MAFVASFIAGRGFAQSEPPRIADLVAANSHPFAYTSTALSGPGADVMLGALGGVQFVLLGEDHMDHATPVFAGALFRTLHDRLGFRHEPPRELRRLRWLSQAAMAWASLSR